MIKKEFFTWDLLDSPYAGALIRDKLRKTLKARSSPRARARKTGKAFEEMNTENWGGIVSYKHRKREMFDQVLHHFNNRSIDS